LTYSAIDLPTLTLLTTFQCVDASMVLAKVVGGMVLPAGLAGTNGHTEVDLRRTGPMALLPSFAAVFRLPEN